jgi:predicted DNA-binding transcriptional regulator AlpA
MRTRIVEEEVVDDRDRLLTPADVCQRLNVSPKWLTQSHAQETFSVVKVGKFNRYLESEVEAYIAARTMSPEAR